jgi:protein-L-isoaspartate(D-aspartate) O-methyltransferase
VDRKLFAPTTEAAFVYADMPIRSGRHHLSAPGIYAEALEALLPLREGQSFLNIGSGSGYFSSVVASIIGPTGTAHGVEIHGDVVEYARSKCDSLGLGHLEFVQGNAYDLDPTKCMRYDRIYVGACASARSKHLYELLEVGGVLVAPFQTVQRLQQLRRVTRRSETVWYVEILKLVQFARLQESETRIPFGLAEPVWSPETHARFPAAYRKALAVLVRGRSKLPREVWMYHIFPWVPKKWFVLMTSPITDHVSPEKVEVYDDGHRVRLGSHEDQDVDLMPWEQRAPMHPFPDSDDESELEEEPEEEEDEEEEEQEEDDEEPPLDPAEVVVEMDAEERIVEA